MGELLMPRALVAAIVLLGLSATAQIINTRGGGGHGEETPHHAGANARLAGQLRDQVRGFLRSERDVHFIDAALHSSGIDPAPVALCGKLQIGSAASVKFVSTTAGVVRIEGVHDGAALKREMAKSCVRIVQ